MVYNKMVRDRIPELIRQEGFTPTIRYLRADELRFHLEQKLDEEVREFHLEKNAEELADILEVVYGLAEALGVSKEALMEIYQQKHQQRGGFEQGIYLISKD